MINSINVGGGDSFYINDSRTLQKEINDINKNIGIIKGKLLLDYSNKIILDDIRNIIDKSVKLTSCAQKDLNQFKDYIRNAPTPQDGIKREEMFNKFNNNLTISVKELENVIEEYAKIRKDNRKGGGLISSQSASSSTSSSSKTTAMRRIIKDKRNNTPSTSPSSTTTSSLYYNGYSGNNNKEMNTIDDNNIYEYSQRLQHHHLIPSTITTQSISSRTQSQDIGGYNGDDDLENGNSSSGNSCGALYYDNMRINDIKKINNDMGELQNIYISLNNDIIGQEDRVNNIHDAMLRTLDSTQKANIELQQATNSRDTSLKRKLYAFGAIAATAGLYILISSL